MQLDWWKLLQLLGNTTTRVAVIFPTPNTVLPNTCLGLSFVVTPWAFAYLSSRISLVIAVATPRQPCQVPWIPKPWSLIYPIAPNHSTINFKFMFRQIDQVAFRISKQFNTSRFNVKNSDVSHLIFTQWVYVFELLLIDIFLILVLSYRH